MPDVSVVIPCYNQGEYIQEAIESVFKHTYTNFEIIVIDDGSTDGKTIDILDRLSYPKTTLIRTENRGLPSARNTGISESRGEYILPLDSDDRIAGSYLEKGVKILESNRDAGIVYCKAALFGAVNQPWDLPDFDMKLMLEKNIIFATALFRRVDWETVGGYKKDMIYGYEDYDFWLSILELGRKVYCIPETLFYYRKYNKKKSMFDKVDYNKRKYSFDKIYERHYKLYQNHVDVLFRKISKLENKIIREKEKKEKRIDRKIKRIIKTVFR